MERGGEVPGAIVISPTRKSRWWSEVSMQNLWQTGKLILHFQDSIAERIRWVTSRVGGAQGRWRWQGGRGSLSYLPLAPHADLFVTKGTYIDMLSPSLGKNASNQTYIDMLSPSLGKNASNSVISLNRLIWISPDALLQRDQKAMYFVYETSVKNLKL